MRVGALSLVGAVLLVAGGARRSEETEAAAPDAAAANQAPASIPTTGNATAAESRDLAVEAEGLRLVDTATGAARPLPFGMPKDQLLAILESFRGPADGGTNSECGAGPLEYAVWADGLTLYFQDGNFAGWALDPRAEGAHATASGVGPGSTRAHLDAAYDAEVEETTLGTEFTAGGLSGLLDGQGPDARIGAMWAGVNCVFR